MKILNKISNFFYSEKGFIVTIILLEFNLMLNNILLNRPMFAIWWLFCIILNVIIIALKKDGEE